ncbi:cypmaclein-like [Aristolochia californica]|uniref:cypmaclein-like n=1 Tax=Aristolochia californica TaxID=171875 RepID=UPI0035D72376
MALRVALLVSVLLVFASLVASYRDVQHHQLDGIQVVTKGANRRLMQEIDCSGLCGERCSQNSRPNVCIRACGTCCVRCKCVPPGTFGNREACGSCYTNMKTHGDKPKCP